MRLKKIISLSLVLLTGISVLPAQLVAASGNGDLTTRWDNPGTSSVISQGDIYYLEKKGSSVYPEKYTFKADGSDGDGIPTNSQLVMQDGKKKPIVPPWEQFYDGLTSKEKKEYILVRDKIAIIKKDKSGKPLKGIKFQIGKKDVCTTDQNGKCTITFPNNRWGPIDLIETIPKVYGKSKYKNKTIKLYRDPGTRFLGEVSGKELGITYEDLRTQINKGTKPEIITERADIIKQQAEKEENAGGIWLKFIDKDQFGKIHVFYIAKKPILKNISWNDIHTSGMVYGWDVIDPHTGLPKSNSENYLDNGKPYKAYVREVKGKKYIVRLLQGKTDYNKGTSKQKLYENDNSEWNRIILPLVQGYRFGSYSDRWSYAEDILRQSDGNPDYSLRKYVSNIAQYNWFGDLTLGSYGKFQYGGKTIATGIGLNGQVNWVQDYAYSADDRFYRGSSNIDSGAADSDSGSASTTDKNWGFRPVLEVAPKEYDGVVFEGELTGNELGITYDDLRFDKDGTKRFPNALIPKVGNRNKRNADEIINQDKYEEANGGMWLKFTDYRYTRDGKPRIFYVAKKPILKNISWNDIHTAGMVYGWDVINPDTALPKSNPEKYKNGDKDYQATILSNYQDNNKYIVRLLQGKTNYGRDVTNTKTYIHNNGNNNSEWNRVILPLVQGYRFGSNTDKSNYSEDLLRQSDGNSNYYLRKYTINTAQYNWFGDLTLGSYVKFQYGNQIIDNGNDGIGSNGQYNWTQEYVYSTDFRSCRGRSSLYHGAASSERSRADGSGDLVGFRPVLEPLNN